MFLQPRKELLSGAQSPVMRMDQPGNDVKPTLESKAGTCSLVIYGPGTADRVLLASL